MSLQDLLSDFVARINNAIMVGKPTVTTLKNRIIVAVCKKMTKLGYFNGFEDLGQSLEVSINLDKLSKLIRVSKPGHRAYVSYEDMPKIVGGKGFNIVSTSKGIFTHIESQKEKVGGELLFQVY